MKNNNELIHFLNSGVKVKHNCYLVELDIYNFNQITAEYSTSEIYLYPISVLTETINHEGKDEIPLVELAKILYSNISEFKTIDENTIEFKKDSRWYFELKYIYNGFQLYDVFDNKFIICHNQLLLLQYLFSRRINVFGIEAKDPRECEINPYKI